jgi:hypothetical protein
MTTQGNPSGASPVACTAGPGCATAFVCTDRVGTVSIHWAGVLAGWKLYTVVIGCRDSKGLTCGIVGCMKKRLAVDCALFMDIAGNAAAMLTAGSS